MVPSTENSTFQLSAGLLLVRMDGSYWKSICDELQDAQRRWRTEQGATLSLLLVLGEFRERLQLLQSGSTDALGVLANFPEAPALLRSRHVRGADNLLRALRAAVGRLEALRAEIGGVHASVWLRFLRCAVQRTPSIAVSPADVAVGAGRGTSMQRVHLPPPLQCMQWVHAVDHAYGLETLLKLQLVEVLSLGMPEAELQQVTRLWELQPNLIGEDLERVDALTDALTLPS